MSSPNSPVPASLVVLLTPAELALRWRICTRTLDRWRKDRCGPPWIALGGRILYRLSDVDAFEARLLRSGP